MNEYKVTFSIFDYVSHDTLPNKLSIKADLVVDKGDYLLNKITHEKTTIQYKNSMWSVDSSMHIDKYKNLEDHLDYVVNVLTTNQGQIKNIAKNYVTQISIIAYNVDANLGIHFNKTQLKFFKELGTEIDLDIYFVGEGN